MNRRVGLVLGALALLFAGRGGAAPEDAFQPVRPPAWVHRISRMAFLTPGQVDAAAAMGVQVVHTNLVWPHYPLKSAGGGLSATDDRQLRDLVAACHRKGMKLSLGLPPFPSVALVRAHPEWRVHPDRSGNALKVEPKEDNLGTRLGCNQGPWGDYLIQVCAELVRDYGVDGFSFDGNYQPALCYCPACEQRYRADTGRELPPKVDLDAEGYRRYLAWRGERLEDHYARMQRAIKSANPDAVLMSWTVNAGRYGHFLTNPRAMPARMNQLFDLPMQEWWLDETNLGASVAPTFGAAYVRAAAGDRPAASEPYLMSRGNPYSSDSFPAHERLTRTLLAITHGSVAPQSLGWPGQVASTEQCFREIRTREPWTLGARRMPWAAMLVSEQTRQFHAYRDVAGRYLPHLFGAFRMALEEHLPLELINDWDLTPERLKRFPILILPAAAALSEAQVGAVREYVRNGGGLVATADTSLCDELGRPRGDFALADLFGVSYRGGATSSAAPRPALDPNFSIALDERYWQERVGVSRLTLVGPGERWKPLIGEGAPAGTTFRGPSVSVSEPADGEVVARMVQEGATGAGSPAIVSRRFGRGKVHYLAAGLDAAYWSYAYPYQRRLLATLVRDAASTPPSVQVRAPMCVQATYWQQGGGIGSTGGRTVVQLFNGLNSTGGHGLPSQEVPLREEAVPIHGVEVRFTGPAPRRVMVQPGNHAVKTSRSGSVTVAKVPPLSIHSLVVAEYASPGKR